MTNPDDPQIGVQPGDVLAGKYRVERVLGRGGMGVVVAAHHLQLDEHVALKFLLPGALQNPEAVRRFVNEARAAVKIKSEHVARVIDVGQLESGSPYMVMEYLEGSDLAAWLRQRGVMPVEQAVDFVLQACEAIAEAHTLGIVHRDLKPANLFCIVRPDGQPSIKVLDFGIAKVTAAGPPIPALTSTTAVLGTPMYMSPEQLRVSKSVDARTDIWSIGVILFELLTARPPFEAEGLTDLVLQIATAPALPLRSLRPHVPPGLEQVIATCLQKDRALRYASVADLAMALHGFGSAQARGSVERVLGTLRRAGLPEVQVPSPGVPGGVPTPPSTGPSPGAPQTASAWGHTGADRGSNAKIVAVIAGALAIVALAVTVAVVLPKPGKALGRGDNGKTSGADGGLVGPTGGPIMLAADAGVLVADSAPDAEAREGGAVDAGPALHAVDAGTGHPFVPANEQPRPPQPDCTSLYYLDSKGNHVFKPECVK